MPGVKSVSAPASEPATERTPLATISNQGASAGPQANQATRAVAAKAVAIALMHISCSAALILYNKFLMMPGRFPFAIPLSTLHMGTAFLLASLLHRAAPSLFPSAKLLLNATDPGLALPPLKPVPKALTAFVPIGACFAVSIVTANAAYQYASVSFLQMVKESVVLWVYLLTVAFGMEALKTRNLLVLSFVTCCAAMAVCGELHFLWLGLLLQLFSSFTQATQAVLTSKLMSGGTGGARIDPLTMVLGCSPVALVLLLPANYFVMTPVVVKQFLAHWPLILGNALAAFVLQIVNAITIRELSATGLALAAVLKDLVIISAAAAVLHESLAWVQVVGFSGAILGISLYSTMKLKPEWFEPAAPAQIAGSAPVA